MDTVSYILNVMIPLHRKNALLDSKNGMVLIHRHKNNMKYTVLDLKIKSEYAVPQNRIRINGNIFVEMHDNHVYAMKKKYGYIAVRKMQIKNITHYSFIA